MIDIFEIADLKCPIPNYFLLDDAFAHQKLVKRRRNLTAHLIILLKLRGIDENH